MFSFRRKRTVKEVIRIHTRRANDYARMALDPEYRFRREHPELARKKAEEERARRCAEELENRVKMAENISQNPEYYKDVQFSMGNIRYSLKRSEEYDDARRKLRDAIDDKVLEDYKVEEDPKHLLSVEDCIKDKRLTFGEQVMLICSIKNMKTSEVYRRAELDRRLFSKIRKEASYNPGRDTCIALAFGLKLSAEEVNPFLKKAGYALSEVTRRDKILEYCFKNRIHEVYDVNAILDDLNEKML